MDVRTEMEGLRSALSDAHRGISYSPEKRADMWVSSFTDELESDLAELGDKAGTLS